MKKIYYAACAELDEIRRNYIKTGWQVDDQTLIELYLIWYNTGVMDMIANVDEGLNLILSDVMEEMLEEAGYEI